MSSQTCDPQMTTTPSFFQPPAQTVNRASSNGAEDKRRQLDRADRALCRVLVNRHNIPAEIIHERFKDWAVVTINKAVNNKYSSADEDLESDVTRLPQDFYQTLEKREAESSGSLKFTKTNQPKGHTSISTRASSADTASSTSTSTSGSGSGNRASSTVRIANPVHTTHVPKDRVLWDTITRASLDPGVWYPILKTAGFTEQNLARFAPVADHFIDDFLKRSFPAMTEVERALFIIAVKVPAAS
ncbi:hypothetical protein C8R46DRAFT_1344575 [Mycena filopes]|nr:hypothetical protein C8R46DRAFT_1344575 [Mycena filopes]